MMIVGSWVSDTVLGGRRWPVIVVAGTVNGIVLVILASTEVFPTNRAGRWFVSCSRTLVDSESMLILVSFSFTT